MAMILLLIAATVCASSLCVLSGDEKISEQVLFNFTKKVPSNVNAYVSNLDYWILDKYGNQQPVQVGVKTW